MNSPPFPDVPPESGPELPESTPENHPLREFLRYATRRAFRSFRALYDPGVETHISDAVLGDFIHMDRIYRLRDRTGRQLRELTEMAVEKHSSGAASGLERDLEVHQHVGDYALFMAGLFPEFIERRRRNVDKPLLSYVGSVVVTLNQPRDYYIVEGRSAYSHVARLYTKLDSGRSTVFERLSKRFEDYLDLMGCIRAELREDQGFQEAKEIIT